MTSFLTSLYLLSFKQTETVHSLDLDCIKISNKHMCTQGIYCDAKSEFFRSRCSDCKQNWGWKKSIKTVEKLFKSYKCIFSSWELNQPLLMFFSNGSIVSIELNNENNTLKKIEIDNNLSGKFIASRIVDAIICQSYIFVTYSEPKLTLIHTNQESAPLSAKILGKKRGKLVGFEPKISHIDLIGPSNKNLERKLSLNSSKDNLLVWWRFSGDDVWPWTPVAYAADRLNMLIYSLNDCIEILCTVKVHGELIDAKYSKQYSNQILTLEELKSDKGISINVSVYEIIGNQCHHVFISKLPLQGKVLSFDWSSTDKLIVSDSNSLLLIYDLSKKTSIVTNILFSSKNIVWHPQDCVALVTGINGQVQCFDAALTCVKFKLFYNTAVDNTILELNSHFTQSCTIQKLLWQKSDLNNSCLFWLDADLSSFVLLKFTFGSITRSSLTALELISQYLKTNAIDEAILLLKSLNWGHANELHFQCLSKVANFLLRKPLNIQVQTGLEMALGTFYNNIEKLPKRTLKLYEHKVNHIARRFFHSLLRYHQFRKAFLLAVDLESQDLFLDLSHVAKQKGEDVLAFVAFHKANELDGSQSSISNSSTASGSTTGTSTASDEEEDKWEEFPDPHVHSNENPIIESSSDYRYWLPASNKSMLTDSWLNSSDVDTHIYQALPKERSMQDLMLASCTNYDESSSSHNPSRTDFYCSSNSSHRDKLQVKSNLSTRQLPDPPLYLSRPSQSSSYHNRIVNRNLSHAATYCGSNSSHNDKLKIISTSTPRPLPDLPSCHSKTSEMYGCFSVSNINAIHNKNHQLIIKESNSATRQPVNVNKTVDEENDELEDSRIKLVHFGII